MAAAINRQESQDYAGALSADVQLVAGQADIDKH